MNLIYCIVEHQGAASIPYRTAGLADVRYRDIAAVVGEVDGRSIEGLTEEQLQEWLAAYQQTNIEIFQARTILPLRFGTVVDHKEGVQDFLAAGYLHIKSALAKVRGRAEFAVQLFWELKAVLEEIYRNKQGLQGASDPVEIGRLLFEGAEGKRKKIVDQVHSKLSQVSIDSAELKRTDDAMIMNRSYLIERRAEGSFDEAMAEFGREHRSYLRFKYVGPIPPYSFVPLEFERGNFELIDRARKTLSLPDRARFAEIKAAYRHLSLQYHPDRNRDDPDAEERFREIAWAYETLETYCLSCGMAPSPGEETEYSFAKDEADKVFVMRARV